MESLEPCGQESTQERVRVRSGSKPLSLRSQRLCGSAQVAADVSVPSPSVPRGPSPGTGWQYTPHLPVNVLGT